MKSTLTLPLFRFSRGSLSFRTRRWIAIVRRVLRGVEAAIGQSSLILIVLALLATVLFAVAQHQNQRSIVLQAETTRIVDGFQSEPVAPAWHRLSAVWRAAQPRQEALLERAMARSGGDPEATLRPWRAFILAAIEDRGLERDIEVVLAFFRRAALCVRMGNCDPDLLTERLGDAPWRFRNQHYPYLMEVNPHEDIDRYFEALSPPPQRAADAGTG